MQNRLEELLELTLHETRIQSRASRTRWFGIVGTITRELFGVMDHNDQESINKEIDKLYRDDAEIAYFTQNATLVIKSEINIILHYEKELTKSLNELRNTTKLLWNSTKSELEKIEFIFA